MNVLFAVAALDELDAVPISHGLVWRPIRRRFGLQGFGVNAYTSEEVGGQVVEEHSESGGHEELYVVVRGAAVFTLDGTEVDAPLGTLVRVAPRVRRVAISRTPDATVLALGGRPGEAFEVSSWEAVFAALPAASAERWDEAIAIHEEALRERPNDPRLLFNLACMESRGGRHLDALLHLQRAVELLPEAARWAQTDSDFAAIRAEPGFPAAPAADGIPEQPEEAQGGGWRAVGLADLRRRGSWIPVRAELDFAPLGINAWIAGTAGDEVIGAHDERESGHEELYLVLAGRARFRLGGEEVDAPAGTLVAVAPPVTRSVVAEAPDTTILVLGARPGVPFAPSEWERRELAGSPVAGEPDAGGEPA